ncbi:MAG: tetratricopeptide repeat protein [Bacteroidetes bacterium]|nr:tetratricopeptide repeat protein [Bacteroidota bacterium]
MFYLRLYFVLLLLHGARFPVSAQKSSVNTDAVFEYKRGLDLFHRQKFGSAQKFFLLTIEKIDNPASQVSIDAQYFAALCALELFHKDAELLLMEFTEQHPENPKVRSVFFQLGKYYFRKKDYTQVIHWFNKVDIYDLSNEELAEYYFKLGYSYFSGNEFDRAQTVFFEIKDISSPYSKPALYYYSHIQYINGNYETALSGFLTLSDSGSFIAVVPYYISHIYYLQQKYDKVIEYAPPILDTTTALRRSAEISRLIGEAYYRKENYDAAVPYLERYQRETPAITREDMYQLGYAYYKSGNFNSAIETFKQVTREKDILAQNAFYHMASCYLEKGKKDFARHAFRAASLTEADKKIREDALFNYAKLSYEQDINAINALEKYIASYPNTSRADECLTLLADLYLRTKNYKNALASLEKIKSLTGNLKNAYQRIAYSRGIELFNDRKYADALIHFDKSLQYPQDKNTELLAHYWKGECWYRLNFTDKAIEEFSTFIFMPGAFNTPAFNLVYYHLGYCYFDRKDYEEALTWFRKFTRNTGEKNQLRKNDAMIRIADCFFVKKDFQNAIDYYDSAITGRSFDTDYALFQKGMALGVTGHKNEKVQTLLVVTDKYKKSIYLDDAVYETGSGYLELGEPVKALPFFETLINDHPSSSYVKKAMLKSGVINYNQGRNDTALAIFKNVIFRFPATDEAMEALAGCRNIYVQNGKVDEYAAYVQGLSFANITQASLDSTTFEAAELRYTRGIFTEAAKDFEKYLQKFPDGFFALHANFYLGECYFKTGNHEKAAANYLYITGRPSNMFTETALLRLVTLYMAKKDFAQALIYFSQLENVAEYTQNKLVAYTGQMRCHFHLGNHELTMQYADKVIAFEKASQDIVFEAHVLKGKAALGMDNFNRAFESFSVTAKTNSEMGAEAKYQAAYIQYLRGNLKESEELIFQLAGQVPSYEYWVARGFILLADVYLMMNNGFQAKATLQSIIDNYEGSDLVEMAKSKLDKILESEEKSVRQKPVHEEPEIKFEGQDIDWERLFEEEKIEE